MLSYVRRIAKRSRGGLFSDRLNAPLKNPGVCLHEIETHIRRNASHFQVEFDRDERPDVPDLGVTIPGPFGLRFHLFCSLSCGVCRQRDTSYLQDSAWSIQNFARIEKIL